MFIRLTLIKGKEEEQIILNVKDDSLSDQEILLRYMDKAHGENYRKCIVRMVPYSFKDVVEDEIYHYYINRYIEIIKI